MNKAEYKVHGGKMIKVELAKEGNTITKIKITGDFFLHPEEIIEEMENAVAGQKINEANLTRVIAEVLKSNQATLLGASLEDLVKCILMAGKDDG